MLLLKNCVWMGTSLKMKKWMNQKKKQMRSIRINRKKQTKQKEVSQKKKKIKKERAFVIKYIYIYI